MIGASLSMQIECECGNLINIEQPLIDGVPMLREGKWFCKCGKGFILHLQETKKPYLHWKKEDV